MNNAEALKALDKIIDKLHKSGIDDEYDLAIELRGYIKYGKTDPGYVRVPVGFAVEVDDDGVMTVRSKRSNSAIVLNSMGNGVEGDILRELCDALLTTAPAPVDETCPECGQTGSHREGCPDTYLIGYKPAEQVTKVGAMEVTHDAEGRVSRVDSRMPLFTTTEGEEVKRLRGRVKDLSTKLDKAIDLLDDSGRAFLLHEFSKEAARLRGGSDE